MQIARGWFIGTQRTNFNLATLCRGQTILVTWAMALVIRSDNREHLFSYDKCSGSFTKWRQTVQRQKERERYIYIEHRLSYRFLDNGCYKGIINLHTWQRLVTRLPCKTSMFIKCLWIPIVCWVKCYRLSIYIH